MQKRTGRILVFTLLAVSAAMFIFWTRYSAAENPRRRFRTGPPFYGLQAQMIGNSGFRMLPEPRLFSTLATKVGGCLVSVRFIRAEGDGRTLRTPYFQSSSPLGRFLIALQLYSPDPHAIEGCALDYFSTRAVDETGHVCLALPPQPDIEKPATFPNGAVYFLRMAPPSPEARSLAYLDGALTVSENGGPPQLKPFRIEGVPLPNGPRLFGAMVPREAPADVSLPPGLTVLSGTQIDKVVQRSRVIQAVETLPRQQLVIAAGRAVRLGVPTPDDPQPLRVTTTLGPQGSITLSIARGTARWQGRVWDNEPFLIALPQESGRPRTVAVARLSRETFVSSPVMFHSMLFPTHGGQQSGAIAGAVRVGERPFGQGYIIVVLYQRAGGDWSEPHKARVTLNSDGRYTLPNLEPGEYRLVHIPSSLVPWISRMEAAGPVEDYLRFRYGGGKGCWQGESADRIVVRGGQMTDIPPLRWKALGSAMLTASTESPSDSR